MLPSYACLALGIAFLTSTRAEYHRHQSQLSTRADPPSRAAWALVYFRSEDINPDVSSKPVDTYTNIHSALEIAGDANNPQVRIQLQAYMEGGELRYTTEMREVFGVGAPKPVLPSFDRPPEAKSTSYTRQVFKLNEMVHFSNQQLLDIDTGKGLVADIWGLDTDYHILGNNCNDFVTKLASKLGLSLPDNFAQMFQGQMDFYRNLQYDTRAANVPISIKANPDRGDGTYGILREFDVTNPSEPIVVRSVYPPAAPIPLAAGPPNTPSKVTVTFRGVTTAMKDFFQSKMACSSSPPDVLEEPNFWIRKDPVRLVNPFAYDPNDMAGDCTRKRSLLSPRGACSPKQQKIQGLNEAGSKEVIVTRTKGSFNTLSIFDNDAIRGAGLAASVAAAAFIILDFIDGDFKAAAFGIASLVAGIGAELLVGGPVGFLVGSIVATLFAILPGLFSTKKEAPANNPARILQVAFFGDKDHTGNKQCNKNRQAQGLEPNCTVVYGAGVISKTLNWEVFDAVAFLVAFNKGHAMSILDMADQFHVIDQTIAGDGDNHTATIACAPLIQNIDETHRFASHGSRLQSPSSGLPCQNAKFAIKRNLITLPFLGSTTDSVYSRIIPAPGGDCKVLSDPSEGFSVSALNLTFRGRPVAVACNLTHDSNPSGAVDAMMNYSNGTTSNLTAGDLSSNSTLGTNTTTDLSTNRAYEKAPPAAGFAPLKPGNSTCLTAPSGRLCLPSGRYALQNNRYGFSTKGTSGIGLPVGGKLTFQRIDQAASNPGVRGSNMEKEVLQTKTYSTNVSTPAFASDFASLYNSEFNITLPQDPTCVCIFSDVKFGGDTQCYGFGGGNLTAPETMTAKSMTMHGGATVWIYAQSYDDLGGALITIDTADLSNIDYGTVSTTGKGTKGSFSQRIAALWVKGSNDQSLP